MIKGIEFINEDKARSLLFNLLHPVVKQKKSTCPSRSNSKEWDHLTIYLTIDPIIISFNSEQRETLLACFL